MLQECAQPTKKCIDYEALKDTSIPIEDYDEVDLFESELEDHGISRYDVRVVSVVHNEFSFCSTKPKTYSCCDSVACPTRRTHSLGSGFALMEYFYELMKHASYATIMTIFLSENTQKKKAKTGNLLENLVW